MSDANTRPGRRAFLLGAAATGTVALSPGGEGRASTAARSVPAQPPSFGTTEDSPKVGGDPANQNHSRLSRITRHNVGELGGAWHLNLEGGGETIAYQQSTCVVQNGVLYVQTTEQHVFAIDAKTGRIKWKTYLGDSPSLMRGVALGEGKVFSAAGDGSLYALDQDTGAPVWKRTLIPEAAASKGYLGLSGACVYHDGLVYIGSNGSQLGMRGRAYAVHAGSGEVAWTFWSCPGEGEFGNDTWEGDSWKTGGAVPWIHPAIDPDLGLVYWTFGNPYPRTDGSTRGGDNLFANSIVALDAKTGLRRWHFQSVHHDIWDYDNVCAPVLADIDVEGRTRHVVIYGGKTSHYYILDRRTGRPIRPVTETPVPQDAKQKTAATQPIPSGRSIIEHAPNFNDSTRPVPFYPAGPIFTPPTGRYTIIFPGASGGADWSYMSFNPATGWFYTGYGLVNTAFSNTRDEFANTVRPFGQYYDGGIAAIDPATNTPVWTHKLGWALSNGNAILSTAGRLLFQGHPDGTLNAMNDATGEVLWTFQCGAGIATAPISYEVDGEQYIAVFAGGGGLPYTDIPKGDHLWAFKLGGDIPPAKAPKPPNKRKDVLSAPVEGSKVNNSIILGRVWDDKNQKPGGKEDLVAQNAMSPTHLRIPAGTRVTFTNPRGNTSAHGAVSFWENEFDTGTLLPGGSHGHTFTTKGEFFYNDPIHPQSTGKIVVY
ncbi:PQQ-binding-like beta-propeller repeat protein [Thermomonospora umbrina]|uniref:Alcohol dehydrogenase (Cytochrome c) n=1 Tax=Thermomonospora umbrina TaxID=111806 RepID=A0A3D9SSZ2_9ACTN|nr:PQQ-binding-like beta-propeller repeat protein [Thermomonospora umbrina]REE97600.1 alcohol dehydrogenase (cytochrome c) [Thermomonospora umbrina]